MFEDLIFPVYLIQEAITHRALGRLFSEQVFIARTVVPVFIDLTTLKLEQNPFKDTEYKFVEVNLDDLLGRYRNFSIRSRYFKALKKIKKGLRGFILLKDEIVIGDIWCDAPSNRNSLYRHPDLAMLGIKYTDVDAYALDMFIDPAFRGKKLAVPLHQSLQWELKRGGWQRVYAYYYDDNISSKWMHWMLNFQELQKLQVSRFLFIIKTKKYPPTKPSL